MRGRPLTPDRILGIAGTAGLLLVGLLILVMLAGGGDGGEETAAAPQATASPEPTPAAEEEPEAEAEEEEPERPTAEQRAERAADADYVSEQGYEPRNLKTYDFDHTLRVIFGEPLDGPEGTLRAFFFVAGENVGTDAENASSDVAVSAAENTEIRLRYRLFEPEDATEPTGEYVRVRFRWDGAALQTLDTVPEAALRRPPGTV